MTVPGHAGQLAIGIQEGVRVAYLQGRAHFYENGDAGIMESALETITLPGAWTVLLISTAGSVRPGLYPGNISIVTDHINLSGINPLVGVAAEKWIETTLKSVQKRPRTILPRA